MSTAAQFDQPYDGDGAEEHHRYPDHYPYDDNYYVCPHDRDCSCGGDVPGPPIVSDPGLDELLGGPAADAMFGLGIIRDVAPTEVPPAVMVRAVLGAQRLASWAKAQAMYWTAALARPGVAVPVSNVLDSIAHRNDEGRGKGIPEELAERAAAGATVAGDQVWDALLAAEAAGMAEPELSAAWLVAPITARRRIADAQELVDELPDTFAALEQGRIEEIRARIIVETTAVLDPPLRRRAEQLILDRAERGLCPGDLRRLASKVVADVDPEAAGRRAEQARAGRGTGVHNLDDDMGRFTADLAAEDAALTQAVLDVLAKAIPPDARHGRGISQLRADIFADLFGELADTGLIDLRGIKPHNETDTVLTDPDPADRGTTEPADTDAQTDPTPPTDAADTTDGDLAESGAQQETNADTEPGPSEPNPGEAADRDSADPGPAGPDPGGRRRSRPTAAELLARLRSVDRESHVDPDCDRRGGLLSMIRLPAGVRVNLDVTVALSTLAGRDDLSARLTGMGVITADTARALAKAAGTVRILLTNNPPDPPDGTPPGSPIDGAHTNGGDPNGPGPARRNNGGIHHNSPDCGTVLDFGRTTYRPPATVLDRVDTRDQRCRFPGCPQIAERCDHDHRTTWDAGGATCPCDLDTLCRFHHRTKTFTTWTAVRDQQTNTLTWTSPLGRITADRPPPDLPTGTPLNLSGTGVGSLKDNPPAAGDAGPDLTAEIDPRLAEMAEQGTEFGEDREPDEPPF